MRTSLRPRIPVCVCQRELTLGRQAPQKCVQLKCQEILLSKPSSAVLALYLWARSPHETARQRKPVQTDSLLLLTQCGWLLWRNRHGARVLGCGRPLLCIFLLRVRNQRITPNFFAHFPRRPVSDNSFIKPTPIPESYEKARNTTFGIYVKTSFPLNVSIKLTLLAAPVHSEPSTPLGPRGKSSCLPNSPWQLPERPLLLEM